MKRTELRRGMRMENRACPICGTEFVTRTAKPRKTCSVECTNRAKALAKVGDNNPMKRPEVVARMVTATQAGRDEPALPPKRTVCARPGCTALLAGQAAIYCSPRCHYDHRATRNAEPTHRRVDFRDAVEACRVASCDRPADHQHHVVYRQHVERAGGDRWHPDNALALCIQHHAQAHSHRGLPAETLRDENVAFAYQLLGAYAYDYLTRRYPGEDSRIALEQVAA